MAARPTLHTSGLSPLSEDGISATASPARGREMRNVLLQKLRPPPLVHNWVFWHEKPSTPSATPTLTESSPTAAADYQPQLRELHSIADVKAFWSLFNNFDVGALPLRNSVHLFHKTITPVWEDPRNVRGGAWTFRVSKAHAVDFWREVCLLAIGEQLQEAVKTNRAAFNDDICGVGFSARFASTLVTIWNRDGENKEGIQKILDVVLENLPEELKPVKEACYYKKHSEHVGFNAGGKAGGNEAGKSLEESKIDVGNAS